MSFRRSGQKSACAGAVAMSLFGMLTVGAGTSQGQRAQVIQDPSSPRAMAPVEVTGNWVSVITEDWRFRMITPQKGDVQGIPLNAAGIKLANAWDAAADEASGNQCKAYGAAAIMRMPTRLRITWADDHTLKFEFDFGQQVRMAHFDESRPPGPRTWQGHAVARWIDVQGSARRRAYQVTDGGAPDFRPPPGLGTRQAPSGRAAPPQGGPVNSLGALRVVTTNLRPQYHRQNGLPVSQDAVVTETMDRLTGPAGDEWLIVQATIEDATYMSQPLIKSTHFKLEPDASKWRPTPCAVERPPVPRLTIK